MLKRNVIVMVILAILLTTGLACDSSNSGGGGGTSSAGYSQSDLAGTWVIRGFGSDKATARFDSQGRMTRFIVTGDRVDNWILSLAVLAAGQLSGRVAHVLPGGQLMVLSFSDTRFIASNVVVGTLVTYIYASSFGKSHMNAFNIRMTRYDR